MAESGSDPAIVRNAFRRHLARRDVTAALEVLPRMLDVADGREEIESLDRALNRFAQQADGRLFPSGVPIGAKLRRVAGSTPSALSVPDSLLERRMFTVLEEAGLRLPYCQYPIQNFRADFAYPEWHVVVEIDGPQHERTPGRDRERSLQMARAGWLTLRIGYEAMDQFSDSGLAQHFAGLLWLRLQPPPRGPVERSQIVLDEARFAGFVAHDRSTAPAFKSGGRQIEARLDEELDEEEEWLTFAYPESDDEDGPLFEDWDRFRQSL